MQLPRSAVQVGTVWHPLSSPPGHFWQKEATRMTLITMTAVMAAPLPAAHHVLMMPQLLTLRRPPSHRTGRTRSSNRLGLHRLASPHRQS
jgi:hypothetical protein